jgi:hypothetical protein
MRTAAQFHVQGTQSPASPVVALTHHTPKSPPKKKGEKRKIRHSTRKKLLLLLLLRIGEFWVFIHTKTKTKETPKHAYVRVLVTRWPCIHP